MRTCIFLRCLLVVLAILGLSRGNLFAQANVLYVEPGKTDSAIEMVHGPHVALYDSQAASRHRLFFFIVGTGANASNSLAIDSTFAKWGYHAISIDYENNVITVAFAHSLDTNAFDQYRKAIITGGTEGDKVKVDAANSILNRFQKLLVYLVEHDPKGGWDEFVKDGKPVWDRIVVAGHSQGSGHAAYLGKMFDVDRVLIFSGPQDYLDDLHQPAPWLDGQSATPPSRFFAFLSKNDPFNVNHQEANCMKLMGVSKLQTVAVKPGEPIQGDYQILVNDFPQKSAHGSTLSKQFTNVWQYMITEHGK